MELAVEEINAAGGVNAKAAADRADERQPKDAKRAVYELVTREKVDADRFFCPTSAWR
jgi:ABC-type branched-subunit amino acid transport system substrate-binding protein